MPESTCLSDLSLDRIVAEGQPGDVELQHIGGCGHCSQKLEHWRSEFEAARPAVARVLAAAAEQVAHERQKRSFWRTSLPKIAVLSSAMCLAVVGVWSIEPTSDDPNHAFTESVRPKGSTVRLFVRREGVVTPGRTMERFQQGDELRFSTSNASPAYFLLVGIGQDSGRVTVYHPFGGESSIERAAGTDVPLPGSLVLDASPETELYLAVFSQHALSAKEVAYELERIHADGADGLSDYQKAVLPGVHHWFEIRRH